MPIRKMSSDMTTIQKTLKTKLDADHMDIVFICAVADEYNRFLEHLDYLQIPHVVYPRLSKLSIYQYRRFILPTENAELQCVVVMQENAGMPYCADMCSRLFYYNPKLVVMSGICGGVPGKVNRGDLVFVKKVFDYGAGKYKNDGTFQARFDQVNATNKVTSAVKRAEEIFDSICDNCNPNAFTIQNPAGETSDKTWKDIRIHYGIMGTGAAVVNAKSYIDAVLPLQQNMIAYDMEAFALGLMCEKATPDGIPWLIVKGVQDLSDTKPIEKGVYNKLTAYLSAAFALEAAKQFFTPVE